MKDNSGLFKDFNFKLVVLNSLLDKNPSFMSDLENYKYKEDIIPFLENILLTDEDMDKVDSITLSNHLLIYEYIPLSFDFEVKELECEKLYNLKSICYE